MLASPAAAAPPRKFYLTATPLLTWEQISWAAAYQIQVSASATFISPIEHIANANQSAYTTPALDTGRYFWRVRARNAAGAWGAWSVMDSFIVDAM
jgi:hypothetical protein